jgi:glucokinase
VTQPAVVQTSRHPEAAAWLPPRLQDDRRVVLTLDAGGTNFVFSAMRGGEPLGEALSLPARGDDQQACLGVLVDGFARLREQAGTRPAAISFAFPGPADYPAGIVGNAHNLPAFREAVPLGPMLEDHFGVPVFINNDGGLFAYGEAIAGFLPHLNALLAGVGSHRRYRTLFGATLGTGFGGGIVLGGGLHFGDNGAAAEVCGLRGKLERDHCVEDGVSIRAVRGEYARRAGISLEACPEPREVFEIAEGRLPGDRAAAVEAFRRMGEVAGDALAHVVTLLDCPVVLGGGLSGAASVFLPALVEEMNAVLRCAGGGMPRTPVRVCNLEDPVERDAFLGCPLQGMTVPGSGRRVTYDPAKRVAVGLSRLGTSRAVAVGAYALALESLDAPLKL